MLFDPSAITLGDVNDDGDIDFVRPNANSELVLFVNTPTEPGTSTLLRTRWLDNS